jgi:lysylphosphatidylglycerol synthetase-like protein (DUF2156 family)
MSRHKKKRRPAPPPRPVPAPAQRPAARHEPDERPRAPWHPIPLAELSVLVGILLMVGGFIVGLGGDRGRLMLVTGMALGSLGGLDTAVREHVNGFASHHMVLAGVPAIAAAAVAYFARAPWIVVVLAGAAVFAAAMVPLRRAWRRASY